MDDQGEYKYPESWGYPVTTLEEELERAYLTLDCEREWKVSVSKSVYVKCSVLREVGLPIPAHASCWAEVWCSTHVLSWLYTWKAV